jgi:hypothetical protein
MYRKEKRNHRRQVDDDAKELLKLNHRQLLDLAHDQQKEKAETRAQVRRQQTSRRIWR